MLSVAFHIAVLANASGWSEVSRTNGDARRRFIVEK